MKTSQYTEAWIPAILRQFEGRMPVAELCCEQRIVLQMPVEVWRY